MALATAALFLQNLVAAELTAFVPLADSCEVNRLMLTNNGTEEKHWL